MYSRTKHCLHKTLAVTFGVMACGSFLSVIAPGKALATTKLAQASVKQLSEELASEFTAENSLVEGAPAQNATSKRATLSELLQTIPDRQTLPVPVPVEEAAPTPTADTAAETETVSLELRLGEKRVYVYKGDSVEVSYPVAIGRPGWETPTGKFEVFHQITDPGWTNPLTNESMPPGPNNPLGDRWIAFWTDGNNSIGFHGTPNRDSVGRAASHGCIRMYNEDVRQLYEMVKVGTPVTVVP